MANDTRHSPYSPAYLSPASTLTQGPEDGASSPSQQGASLSRSSSVPSEGALSQSSSSAPHLGTNLTIDTAAPTAATSPNPQLSPAAAEKSPLAQLTHRTAATQDNSSDDTLDYTGMGQRDPLGFASRKKDNVSKEQMKAEYPTGKPRKMHKFYTRQNELIDQFLGAGDEERAEAVEEAKMGPRIQFAINASFTVNFCLFCMQLYAAVSTRSLSLFATAADAFMDLVSSCVMFTTARMAARPSDYKYPVGRTRIETVGIILFCALMTTVAVLLLVESGTALGNGPKPVEPLKIVPLVCVASAIVAKSTLMTYCFFLRRYPSVHVFFIDHRNDIVVNTFGLIMSIVGHRFVWYLDPLGAICIALLILFSWVSNAFEQVWLLVGKSAPKEFISKVVYMTITHDPHILKVDTCRAYHAGQNYYVEVDVVMDETLPLKITHDVSQSLQRKIEGLGDVERAFVHVDYESRHDVYTEHKALYEPPRKERRSLMQVLKGFKKDTKDKVAGENASGSSRSSS